MKKMLKIIGIIILVLIILTGLYIYGTANKIQDALDTKETWNREDGTIYKDIVYDEVSKNTFDLYIPSTIDKNEPQGVLLFVHGGGWSGGSKKDMDFACKRYTKLGFITATVDYSLINQNKPDITMLTQVDDIEKAVYMLKKEIEEKGFVVDKLALMGGSAGGHLSLLYAYTRAEKSAIPVVFVASQSGPVGAEYGVSGGTDEEEAIIKLVSPIQHVNENTVPTLLAHGQKDSIVPYEGTMALIEKLKEYDIPYDFVDYPNSNHTLESDPDSHKKWREMMHKYLEQYFN